MVIEDATEEDLPDILAIYNDVIATSTAVFSEEPVGLADRRAWLSEHRLRGQPVLVARSDGAVAGFAAYGDFRPWPGYSTTVEHSLHVSAGHRRRGIGRRLLQELIARARSDHKHVMVAAIDADNEASLKLHAQLGFKPVGHMPRIAHKFGRPLDLTLLQLEL